MIRGCFPACPPLGKLAVALGEGRAFTLESRKRPLTPAFAAMPDAQRTLFLVCYDIADPRRLQRVHKFLLGYKVGGQKSFFECWLTPAELRTVRAGLLARMNLEEDRAHLFQLDPRMACRFMGKAEASRSTPFLVL